MNRFMTTLLFASTIACTRDPGSSSTDPSPAQGPPPAQGPSSSHAHAHAPPGPAHDTRRPLPLLAAMANHQRESMREHLTAVGKIIAALSSDDFVSAESAARQLGMSSQMNQMCNHLGAAAPEFTTQALAFHATADRIVDAARASDQKRVLGELSATLDTCVGCHASWRQEIVDEPTWQARVHAQRP